MRIDNRNNTYYDSSQYTVAEDKDKDSFTLNDNDLIKAGEEKNMDYFSADFDEMSREMRDKKEEMTDAIKNSVDKIKNNREMLEKTAKNIAEQRKKAVITSTCIKIFQRMMSGDHVAAADLQYLRKHDSCLYVKAVSIKSHKKNPRKYNRISPFKDKKYEESIAFQDETNTELTAMTSESGNESANLQENIELTSIDRLV